MGALKLFVAVLVVVLLGTYFANAQQSNCAPHEKALAIIAGWNEARQAVMLDGEGFLLEMFANIETGEWTALRTSPDGMSCMVGSGNNFEFVNEELHPTGIAL